MGSRVRASSAPQREKFSLGFSLLYKKNPVGQVLRQCANALNRSDNPMGSYFRHIKSKSGYLPAMVATGKKLEAKYYLRKSHNLQIVRYASALTLLFLCFRSGVIAVYQRSITGVTLEYR